MIKKKLKIIITVSVVIAICLTIIIHAQSKFQNERITINIKNNFNEYDKQYLKLIESFQNEDGSFSTINAIENSYDQYSTVYGYLTKKELNEKFDVHNVVKHILDEESVDLNEVEKVYLCYSLIKDEEDGKSIIEKYVKKLIKESWNIEGFYLSKEYNESKSNGDMLLVKLNNTFEIIEMANYVECLDLIDNKELISEFLKNSKKNIDTISSNYYINNCYKYLYNYEQIDESFIRDKLNDKYILENIKDDSAMGEMFFLIKYAKENKFDLSSVSSIVLDYTSEYLEKNNEDLQVIYRYLVMMKLVNNHSVNYEISERLSKNINMFEAGDRYPHITRYQEDFKQMYIYYTTMKMLGENIKDNKENVELIMRKVQSEDLLSLDLYEIYSYIQLNNIFNLNIIGKKEKEKIVKNLEQYNLDTLNENNIMSYTNKIYILNALGYKFKEKDFPYDSEEIFNLILDKREPFLEGKEIIALKYLDAVQMMGIVEFPNGIKKYIEDLPLNQDSDALSYELFYKEILLKNINNTVNSNEKITESLRKKFWFTMSKDSKYIEPRINMLMYELDILENGGTNNSEFR